jgi:DNA adenine methylase
MRRAQKSSQPGSPELEVLSISPSANERNRTPRPFLKWAGGKGQLLSQLAPLLPAEPVRRYFEPFVGGGAMFFAMEPRVAILSDINPELIDVYTAVQRDVEGLIAALAPHRYEEAYYYEVRAWDPAELPLLDRAARTIYLNRAGFNGLYRLNSKGGFNVPFGRHTNPTLCDAPNLRACSRALADAHIEVRRFDAILDHAEPSDFVYLDPPYVPLSATSNFTSYSATSFDEPEQRELAEVFRELTRRGVKAMLSNSNAPLVHELYEGFDIQLVSARRNINSKATSRHAIHEVLVRNY